MRRVWSAAGLAEALWDRPSQVRHRTKSVSAVERALLFARVWLHFNLTSSLLNCLIVWLVIKGWSRNPDHSLKWDLRLISVLDFLSLTRRAARVIHLRPSLLAFSARLECSRWTLVLLWAVGGPGSYSSLCGWGAWASGTSESMAWH